MSIGTPTTTTSSLYSAIGHHRQCIRMFTIYCSSSDSNSRRGFRRQPTAKNKKDKKAHKLTTSRVEQDAVLEARKSSTRQPGSINRAPGLSFQTDGKSSNIAMDLEFEERLKAVKRSALEQKRIDGSKEYESVDYDAPVESASSTVGLGTKIGIGGAIVVFGLVFALGDFLPTGSEIPSEEAMIVDSKLSEDAKQNLQARLKEYEAILSTSPEDPNSLEGAAVTLAELGEFTRAASLLEDLIMKKPDDPDAFRLLGEVKYQLRDYEGSAAAYRRSAMESKTINFDVLRGLTNALVTANKPDEAVQVLLASRESLKTQISDDHSIRTDGSSLEKEPQLVDPIQVELLLGKAYADWGHVSDAVAIYDQLISSHPDDYRGYLAKGIILKQNDRVGDAERMFIQARFFAPEKAKALVGRYSRQ